MSFDLLDLKDVGILSVCVISGSVLISNYNKENPAALIFGALLILTAIGFLSYVIYSHYDSRKYNKKYGRQLP